MITYPNESPFAAVSRVLASHDVMPDVVLVMQLIDTVRFTTPPPRELTIGMLTRLLQALQPHGALEAWAYDAAREIVGMISKRPEVKRAAGEDETLWCRLEGVLQAMLLRVCRGQDLGEELCP